MPPPKQSWSNAGHGRPKGSESRPSAGHEPEPSNPFESSDDQADENTTTPNRPREAEEDQAEPEKSIPKDLLTRILHEFFAREATRISRDANAAVGKYVDVFVREAIARAAVEKKGGFLEVEDLEKIVPQLLLDL